MKRALGVVIRLGMLLGSVAMAQDGAPPRPNLSVAPVFGADNPEGLELTSGMVGGQHTIRRAWKRRVEWKVSPPSTGPSLDMRKLAPPLSAADRAEMGRTLDALISLLRATPTGTSGIGFWVDAVHRYDTFDGQTLPKGNWAKHPLTFSTSLSPYFAEDVRDAKGGWTRNVRGETDAPHYVFNLLPGRLSHGVLAFDDTLYLRPRVLDQFQGFPVYDEELNRGSVLVITRGGRDPWTTVPLSRVMPVVLPLYEKDKVAAEERLANAKKKLAECQTPAWEQSRRDAFEKTYGSLRTSKPSSYQTRLASLENELKVLRDEAQKAANPEHDAKGAWYWNPIDAWTKATAQAKTMDGSKPACFVFASEKDSGAGRPSEGRYAMKGEVVVAGSVPDCREIVETNHGYWDLSLPRTAPQLLVIHNFLACANLQKGAIVIPPTTDFRWPEDGCRQVRRMWSEVDWSKVTGLLAR